jgi:hypothetical protein
MRALRGHDSGRRCCFRSAGARESGRNVTARRPKADAAIQEPQGARRSLDRRVASLLGLTPRQNSTGGKEKLGAIKGNRYRRKMLVVGCTSALRVAGKRNGALAAWIAALRAKAGAPGRGGARQQARENVLGDHDHWRSLPPGDLRQGVESLSSAPQEFGERNET